MPRLSIVIPALNAARSLPDVLAALSDWPAEIIVVDGGSEDDTVATAEAAGATVLSAPRGRGPQMAAGAERALSDALFFLHADTVPSPAARDQALAFIGAPENRERAAAFRYQVDLPGRRARLLERLVAWRSSVLGLPYGDQGLLIGRGFYQQLGGFRPLSIMEDVDLVRRIGRRRLVMLDVALETSGIRHARHGIAVRSVRNLACLALYFLGVPPRALVWLYG